MCFGVASDYADFRVCIRALLIVLSALAFWRLALRMARRERLDLAPATDLAAVYLLAMTLGAALAYLVLPRNWPGGLLLPAWEGDTWYHILHDFVAQWSFRLPLLDHWEPGRNLTWNVGPTGTYGGPVIALVGLVACVWATRAAVAFLDIGAICLAAALPIAKVGCLLHCCCYGSVTGGTVVLWRGDMPLVPVQVYDFALLLGILVALWHIRARALDTPGWLPVWFLVLYCAERFATEFARGDRVPHVGPFRFTHVAAVVGAVAAGYLLTHGRAKWGALIARLERRHADAAVGPEPIPCESAGRPVALLVDMGLVAVAAIVGRVVGDIGWRWDGLWDEAWYCLHSRYAAGFPVVPAAAAFLVVFGLLPLAISRTLGMALFGLRIETDSGHPPRWRALRRACILFLSVYSAIGLLRPLFDPQRRALHDVVSGNASRVCRRDRWRLLGRRCLGAGSG